MAVNYSNIYQTAENEVSKLGVEGFINQLETYKQDLSNYFTCPATDTVKQKISKIYSNLNILCTYLGTLQSVCVSTQDEIKKLNNNINSLKAQKNSLYPDDPLYSMKVKGIDESIDQYQPKLEDLQKGYFDLYYQNLLKPMGKAQYDMEQINKL